MELLDFPTELLLEIYKQCQVPAQITTFNLVSRDLYSIWRLNAESISEAVLRQAIECYDAALEVVEISFDGETSNQDSHWGKTCEKTLSLLFQSGTPNYPRILTLNATLLSNAREASMVGDWHQRAGIPSEIYRRYGSTLLANMIMQDHPYTRLLERDTAFRVFYRFWCITPAPCYLNSLSMTQTYQLCEMVLCLVEGLWKTWSKRNSIRSGLMFIDRDSGERFAMVRFHEKWQNVFFRVVFAVAGDLAVVDSIRHELDWQYSRSLVGDKEPLGVWDSHPPPGRLEQPSSADQPRLSSRS